MKFRGLLVAAVLAVFGNIAPGFSPPPAEIRMGDDPAERPVVYKMVSALLPSGDVQFTMTIEHFPYDKAGPQFALCDVDLGPTKSRGFYCFGFARALPYTIDDGRITVVFTVTRKELADPLLSFCFSTKPASPQEDPTPVGYAPLSKYYKAKP